MEECPLSSFRQSVTYRYGNVETVDQGDVVEVETAGTFQGDFSQGGWGSTSVASALEFVTAVARQAVVSARVAPGPGPETSGPVIWGLDGVLKREANNVV